MTPDPSRLPELSRPLARAMTMLAPWRGAVDLAGGEDEAASTLSVGFGAGPRVGERAERVDITVRSRFGVVSLHVGADLCDALSDRLLPEWREEQPGVPDLSWRAVLLLTLLAEATGLAETLADVESTFVVGGTPVEAPARVLGGSVRIDGVPHAFDLVLHAVDEGEAGLLAQVLGTPAPRRMIDPGFRCSLRLPLRRLDLERFRRLGPGDAVLSASAGDTGWPVTGRVPGVGRFSARLSAEGSLHILRGRFLLPDASQMTDIGTFAHETETEAETEVGDDDRVQPIEVDTVSHLPVFLDVLLGSRRLTLAEVSGLAPGAVLDLEIDLTAPVTILANGAAIGTGHLVQCGGSIGVQIERWPDAEGTGDA